MAQAATTSAERIGASDRKIGDSFVPGVFFILLVLVPALLFYTWSRVQVVKIGYEIFNANSEMRKLDQENKELILEIATMKSPKRIEKVAREQLGLVPPKDEQILILR